MRVALLGESPNIPSGFGSQCGLLAKALNEHGHQVTIMAQNTTGPCPIEGVDQWIINTNNIDNLDDAITRFEPDCVIVFSHVFQISRMLQMRSAPANCPVYVWLPWEADTLPKGADSIFYNMEPYSLVHLTDFASDLWKNKLDSTTVIPHGYDPIFRKLDTSRQDLRRKWSEKLRYPLFDDSIVLLNLDRNIRHKRWDATYDLLKRLNKQYGGRVQLIAHTKLVGETVPEMTIGGYDLKELEKLYEVEGKVCYTDFDWSRGLSTEELCELYNLVDFRISTSSGEGFGVPTIEAAVCGCPQILNRNQAVSELLVDENAIVNYAMLDIDRGSLWRSPNVDEMSRRIMGQIDNPSIAIAIATRNKKHVEINFNWEQVGRQWHEYIMEERDENQWSKHRYGFQADYLHKVQMKELALTIKDFAPASVLEIGSFSGVLLEFLLSLGISVEGMEDTQDSQDVCATRSKLYTHYKEYTEEWLEAEILVMTDQFPLIHNHYGEEVVGSIIKRMSDYKWVLVRHKPVYKWGLPRVQMHVQSKMVEAGLVRRIDLEEMARSKKDRKTFSHEIWQSNTDTSMMVPGLLED